MSAESRFTWKVHAGTVQRVGEPRESSQGEPVQRPRSAESTPGSRFIAALWRRSDAVLDDPHQLPVEVEEQLRLIAGEPSSKLLGGGTWSVVAGVLRRDFRRILKPRGDPVARRAVNALERSVAVSSAF